MNHRKRSDAEAPDGRQGEPAELSRTELYARILATDGDREKLEALADRLGYDRCLVDKWLGMQSFRHVWLSQRAERRSGEGAYDWLYRDR